MPGREIAATTAGQRTQITPAVNKAVNIRAERAPSWCLLGCRAPHTANQVARPALKHADRTADPVSAGVSLTTPGANGPSQCAKPHAQARSHTENRDLAVMGTKRALGTGHPGRLRIQNWDWGLGIGDWERPRTQEYGLLHASKTPVSSCSCISKCPIPIDLCADKGMRLIVPISRA